MSHKQLDSEPWIIQPLYRPKNNARSSMEEQAGFESLLNASRVAIERLLMGTFPKEPVISCTVCEESGYILASLIAPAPDPKKSSPISFSQLLSHRLVPGEQLSCVALSSLDFTIQGHKQTPLRLNQATIQVPKDKMHAAKRNIAHFQKEVALAQVSLSFAAVLSSSRSSLIDTKRLAIWRHLIAQEKRMGRKGVGLINHAQWVMSIWPTGYHNRRLPVHLARMIVSSYLFSEQIEMRPHDEQKRRGLKADLFPVRLSRQKNALGICVLLSFLKNREIFGKEQVLAAAESILPDIRALPDSQFADNFNSSDKRIVYIEVEKASGVPFSRAEIMRLREMIPSELKQRVEKLIHPVFIPRSDEELLHHISLLSRELREITDMPQAMISFSSQTARNLTFSALLVRVRHPGDLEVSDLLKNHASVDHQIHAAIHLVKTMGHLRDIHPKEAIALEVSLLKKDYLRKDGSIDLVQARRRIVSMLSALFGDVRDVNGGMIVKQSESFIRLKEAVGALAPESEFLLENFFYSITPTPMQGVLGPRPLLALFHLVETAASRLSEKNDTASHQFLDGHCLFVLTTSHMGLKERLDASLEQLAISDLDLATSEVAVDGKRILAYLFANHDPARLRLFLNQAHSTWEQFKANRARQQILRLNIPKGILSLDPRIGGDQQSGIVKRMLYDGLMRLDSTGLPVFALASSYEISTDRLTYTFTLKKDIVWSTGDPIIAYDFEYAWKKVLDPSFQTPFVSIFYVIKNATAASEGRCPLDDVGVRAINERSLEVTLEKPAPYFLELAAHWAFSPVSSKSDRIHPGWAHTGAETYASSGPFKLSLFDYGRRIEFVKNPRYWDASHVKLESIKITMIQDSHVELKMYENDEIDWVGQPFSILPFESSHKLKSENKLLATPTAATTWLDFNVESFPFNNLKMRRAFSIGFNRQKLTEEVIPGRNAPATGVIPLGMSIREEPYFKDNDKASAKKLFEEALEEIGTSREKLPPISIICADTELWKGVCRELKKQLEDLFGITIRIRRFAWDEFFNHRSNNFFQIAGISWYCWHSDPTYVLDLFKYRSNSLNSTQWEHPQYTSYLDAASLEKDEKKRIDLLRKAEALLIEEMPVMPLYYDGDCYMRKEYLKGLNISKTGDIDFKEAYIEHE